MYYQFTVLLCFICQINAKNWNIVPDLFQMKIMSWNVHNENSTIGKLSVYKMHSFFEKYQPDFFGGQEVPYFDTLIKPSRYKGTINESDRKLYQYKNPIYYDSANWKMQSSGVQLLATFNKSKHVPSLTWARFLHIRMKNYTFCVLNSHLTPNADINLSKIKNKYCRTIDFQVFTGDLDIKLPKDYRYGDNTSIMVNSNNTGYWDCGHVGVMNANNQHVIQFMFANSSSEICIQKRQLIHERSIKDLTQNFDKAAVIKTFCLGKRCDKCIKTESCWNSTYISNKTKGKRLECIFCKISRVFDWIARIPFRFRYQLTRHWNGLARRYSWFPYHNFVKD